MKYLKANGGVGLVPDPGMAGAYLMMKQGKSVSVTWEEALRHELPFILGAHEERSQGVEAALEAKIDALEEAHREHLRIHEDSDRKRSTLVRIARTVAIQNRELRVLLGLGHESCPVYDYEPPEGSEDV